MRLRSYRRFLVAALVLVAGSLVTSDAMAQLRDQMGDRTGRERMEPCGAECYAAARAACAECAESDDPEACRAAVKEELAACLAEAGCEVPERPDREPPCGAECYEAASAAAGDCRGSDDPEACMAAVKKALAACLAEAGCEIPERPERPEPCGVDCYSAARAACAECAESDDPEACKAAAKEELAACLAEAGCEVPQRPERPERPEPCGADCHSAARAAYGECEGSDDPEACRAAVKEELAACLAEAGCEVPERPERPDRPEPCGMECLEAAGAAARACMEADDPRACMEAVKADLAACLADAGCEVPELPERPRRERCGQECRGSAIAAARECLENGGGREECCGVYHEALDACRAEAACGEDVVEEVEQDTQELGLLLDETFVRGDSNNDGSVDISDAIATLSFLFLGNERPECLDAADANDDGSVDVSDPMMALTSLFQQSTPLPAPFPEAGLDPTADGHVCGMPGA